MQIIRNVSPIWYIYTYVDVALNCGVNVKNILQLSFKLTLFFYKSSYADIRSF